MLPTRPLLGSAPRFEYPKQGERRPLPRFARTRLHRRLGSFFRLRALIECRLAQCGRRRAGGGATLGTGSETRRLPTASSGWPWRERSCSLRRMRYVHDPAWAFCGGSSGRGEGGIGGGGRGPGGGRLPGGALAIASRHTGGLSCRVDASALRRAPGFCAAETNAADQADPVAVVGQLRGNGRPPIEPRLPIKVAVSPRLPVPHESSPKQASAEAPPNAFEGLLHVHIGLALTDAHELESCPPWPWSAARAARHCRHSYHASLSMWSSSSNSSSVPQKLSPRCSNRPPCGATVACE